MGKTRAKSAPASKMSPRLGAHVSVAGGLETGFARGLEAGCDCIQIFVKNQRQWRAKPLTNAEVRAFLAAQKASGIEPVMAHGTYLLNLAAPPGSPIRTNSIDTLTVELERCEALAIPGLVFHPGAYLAGTLEEGIRLIADGMDEVHRRCAGFRSRLLLEVTAGQGSAIGHRFEHLAEIIRQTAEPQRIGVCLDTCHLLVAGYDIRAAGGYAATMAELDHSLGVKLVECIHMNDSKRELGSRVDRHEHIGKGCIGREGFRLFVNDPRWKAVPMILETPKGKNARGVDLDKVNLKRLWDLVA